MSGQLPRPVTVSSARGARRGHYGWVQSTIADGELFLEDDSGRVYRLTWQPADRERRRPLPPGHYRIRGYRIRKKDKRGIGWHLSVSSAGFGDVTVRPRQVARVSIRSAVTMQCQVQGHGRQLRVSVAVLGEEGNGLSIYRQGRRIRLGYRLIDAHGRTLSAGVMRYG